MIRFYSYGKPYHFLTSVCLILIPFKYMID